MTAKTDKPDANLDEEAPPIEPRGSDTPHDEGGVESPDRPDGLEGAAPRRRSRLARIVAILVLLALAAFVAIDVRAGRAGYGYRLYAKITGKIQQKEAWTPEKISQDPEGYLVYALETARRQNKEREEQLAALQKRKAEVDEKASALSTRVRDIQNVHDRLETASQRADDEDRWPVKLGGHTFDKEMAQAVIASAAKYVEDRAPLVSAYENARQKLAGTESAIKLQIDKLDHLQEKVALDLERVRLNKGMAAMEDLRQTEAALASISDVVVDVSEDPATALSIPPAPAAGKGQVDIEKLFK